MTERRSSSYRECLAVMGTLTAAQKAQKALSSAAIPTSVGKSESLTANRGCMWAVTFSCNQKQNVASVLANAGISVRAWEETNDIS